VGGRVVGIDCEAVAMPGVAEKESILVGIM
jgi:hypothetical protein